MTLHNPCWGQIGTITMSKLNSYFRCGARFRMENIYHLRPPGTAGMMRGRGFHKAIEEDNKQVLKGNARLDLSALLNIAYDYYDMGIATDGVFIPMKDQNNTDKIIEKARAEMGIAVELYHGMEKTWVPTIVEEYKVVDIGYPLLVAMRIDMITTNNLIYDWKSTAKKPSIDTGPGLQEMLYSRIYATLFRTVPAFRHVYFVARSTVKKSEIIISDSGPIKSYELLDRHISLFIDAIEKNVFLPASPGSYACSEGGCAFFYHCDFKNG